MRIIFTLCSFALILSSCGNRNNNASGNSVTFAPRERTSSLSAVERGNAIEQKRAENSINIENFLSQRSIRMSILPPALSNDIREKECEDIILKMLQISSQYGISGVNGSSPIAFALAFNSAEKSVTGSIPQKKIIKYEITYYVLNTQTGDVYASCSDELVGVGDSFEMAVAQAIYGMTTSDSIQQMLKSSEERIISWYDKNISVIKNNVDIAITNKEYAYAVALLKSVPETATKAHEYVSSILPSVLKSFKQQVASDELAKMKDAIAAAQAEYNPAVAAHLAMLPIGSPEAKIGSELYDKYLSQIDGERLRKISAKEREHMEEIELKKLEMKYEADAIAMSCMAKQNKQGPFSNFGKMAKAFFNGSAVMSIFSNILSRSLFIF